MKITDEMLPFIEQAMDEAITKAYPKTGVTASLRAEVTMATLKGLEKQKESLLSRALFFASKAANTANRKMQKVRKSRPTRRVPDAATPSA